MLNRIVDAATPFGPRSWLAVFIWLIALALGFYFYSMWQERNPVRMGFLRRVGLGLLILSGVGLVLMLLRGIGVSIGAEFLAWPLWGYLAMLATLGFAGWAGWFYSQKLPALATTTGRQPGRAGAPVSRQAARPSSGGGARTYSAPAGGTTGTAVRSEPRPVATTTRRESRRDRKRKSR
jgi:hypothetical protein